LAPFEDELGIISTASPRNAGILLACAHARSLPTKGRGAFLIMTPLGKFHIAGETAVAMLWPCSPSPCHLNVAKRSAQIPEVHLPCLSNKVVQAMK